MQILPPPIPRVRSRLSWPRAMVLLFAPEQWAEEAFFGRRLGQIAQARGELAQDLLLLGCQLRGHLYANNKVFIAPPLPVQIRNTLVAESERGSALGASRQRNALFAVDSRYSDLPSKRRL